MSFSRILFIACLVFAGYWLYTHRGRSESSAPTPPSGAFPAAPSGDASACVRMAEDANRKVHDALLNSLRPPVDPAVWSSAEGSALAAVSDAESACSVGGEANLEALQEVRAALHGMRSLVGDVSSTLRGGDSASDAASRQGEIEAHLDRARALLRK